MSYRGVESAKIAVNGENESGEEHGKRRKALPPSADGQSKERRVWLGTQKRGGKEVPDRRRADIEL